jgi:hypothetical protein
MKAGGASGVLHGACAGAGLKSISKQDTIKAKVNIGHDL